MAMVQTPGVLCGPLLLTAPRGGEDVREAGGRRDSLLGFRK